MSRPRSKPSPKRRKIVTTVNLEPDIVDYLRGLQEEYDRDRSYLINALIKEHRRRRSEIPAAMAGPSEVFAKQLTA